jgi:hypothetical protein
MHIQCERLHSDELCSCRQYEHSARLFLSMAFVVVSTATLFGPPCLGGSTKNLATLFWSYVSPSCGTEAHGLACYRRWSEFPTG